MLLDTTGIQDRRKGSDILQGFYFSWLAVNPLLGGLLSDHLGFANTLIICAALSAAGFLFAFLFLPETRQAARRTRLSPSEVVEKWLASLARS